MRYTSIQISPKTRQSLAQLKQYPRETYDDVLNNLIELVPEGDEEGKYSPEFRASILRGLRDVPQSKEYTEEEVKKSLGLK